MDALANIVDVRSSDSRFTTSDVRIDPSKVETITLGTSRVLIVDDEPFVRSVCKMTIQPLGVECVEVSDGLQALEQYQTNGCDLVLLDVDMPRLSGMEVCRRLRAFPGRPYLKIILFSGRTAPDDLAQMLLTGADDFLTKPFSPQQLQSRVQAALRLQHAQERSARLNQDLLVVNSELEKHLSSRDSDLVQARNALVLALAKLSEYRDNDTGKHLFRIQTFSRRLAEQARIEPRLAGQIDQHFVDMVACCAPLHDIGKVGLSDEILLKPGSLTPDQRRRMQTHTIIGAETLRQVAEQFGFARAFLQMSIDITRHHHERYDGTGYPDRLAGLDIPLSARIVAVCDVYDALRSPRVYKKAIPHRETMTMIRESRGTHFDPILVECLDACESDIERMYVELCD